MNIKSLLLGSAVASVSFTGAQAADAIFVPEPEPMEYVRVCDVYGAGFFYIPGTETCLKIGGYVRYQIDWAEGDDGWRKFGRANVELDARSETELGTLRSFIQVWFNQSSGFRGFVDEGEDRHSSGVTLRQAFVELGGLFFGIKTTLWDGDLDGEYDYWGYDSRVHTVGYNFAFGNGVNVALALEEYDYDYDYKPNVVGKVGISQGWGSLNVWGAYDATAEEGAAKAIAKIKLADPLELQLAGVYASGVSQYSPYDYKWAAGAHLKYKVNEKLALGFGGEYFGDSFVDGYNDWALGAVVDYEVVKGFASKLAVNYYDGDSFESGDNHWGGFLRLQRNF